MIPFYQPYFDHSELAAALHPGTGRAEFESAVAKRMGAKYGVAFAYGRSGLVASLKALGLEQAEIVMPAYTCVSVAQAVVASGNSPAFVDIDLTDFNMDLGALPQALTRQTGAIIATHLYGFRTDVDAIRAIAGDHRIVIIEDCAQRLPFSADGSSSLRGDLGLCSFGSNKELCAVQGGVVITNIPSLYERIKTFRDQQMHRLSARICARRWVQLIANYLVFRKSIYGPLLRVGLAGANNRLTETSDVAAARLPDDHTYAHLAFQGRVGLVQLGKLEAVLAKRRALAELYTCELRGVPGAVLPPLIPDAHYSYYTLRIAQRDDLHVRSQMLFRGVAVDETYEYALPCLKPYRPFAKTESPCALQAAQQVVNLPIYPHLSIADAKYIAASARRILEEGPQRH